MRHRRFLLLILALAAPAARERAAAAAVDTDHVTLGIDQQGHVFYGALGTPAEIAWSVRQAGPPKVYRVQTHGQLWVRGPNASTLCVRRKVTFLDATGKRLAGAPRHRGRCAA